MKKLPSMKRDKLSCALLALGLFLPYNILGIPKQVMFIVPCLVTYWAIFLSYSISNKSLQLAFILFGLILLSTLSGGLTTGYISIYWVQDIFWLFSSVGIISTIAFRAGDKVPFAKIIDVNFLRNIVYLLLILYVACLSSNTFNEQFAVLYSEDKEIYTPGYNIWRYFGVFGQPGRAGFGYFLLLCTVCILSLRNRRGLWDLKVILVFLVATSQSRTAFVFTILLLIACIMTPKLTSQRITKFLIFSAIGLILSSIYSVSIYNKIAEFDFMSRILDGNFLTMNHRIFLKFWAFETIGEHPVAALFGFGGNREFLVNIEQNVASELSLWTPDSSQTVFLIRNGILGSMLIYAIVIIGFKRLLADVQEPIVKKLCYYIVVLLVTYSLVDPAFHTFKLPPELAILLICMVTKTCSPSAPMGQNRLIA